MYCLRTNDRCRSGSHAYVHLKLRDCGTEQGSQEQIMASLFLASGSSKEDIALESRVRVLDDKNIPCLVVAEKVRHDLELFRWDLRVLEFFFF